MTFASVSPNPVQQTAPRYYGKYRGKVLNNVDPLFLGRIIAEVAAIPGSKLNWALPCIPYAGQNVGFYAIPPIEANVWIEFEGGDPTYPVWTGCFWTEGQVPEGPDGPPPPETKLFKTESITMVLNDVPEVGGFILECFPDAVDTPLKMIFNSTGIEINAEPAIITMVTEEGITLEFPPGKISMTEANIITTLPESSLTLNETSVLLETGTISMTATEAASISASDINLNADGAVQVSGGGDVSVEAGGAAQVSGGGDVSVEAGGAAQVSGGGDVSVEAGGAAQVSGGGDVSVEAGGAVQVTAGADIAMTAIGATEVTSVGIALTGAVEVTGDLLIDGQQPLVI